MHTQGGLYCFMPREVMPAGRQGAGQGAARPWFPAALRDFACHFHLPFLPSYVALRGKRGKPDKQPLSHTFRYAASDLHDFGSLSQSFSVCPSWTLAMFLAQGALCSFLKTTLTPLGCLEHPLEPLSPISVPQLPWSQGHTARAKPLW